ncbi:MAG: AAA family ATPase [Thermodesulfobacteriota bacterium]|nr:AAA family ATPase [Thermodesulfobacteriota bacterium]
MTSVVKQEFLRWVVSLDHSKLTKIDRKLLNLLVTHFDTLAPLTTARGSSNRASKLNELIQKYHATLSSEFPDVSSHQSSSSEKFDQITELKIGPFRGFATNESFSFDKKYTFMYGPNGSGKSSFCDGLEYALLGGIEEAEAKRIAIADYIRNTQKGSAVLPIAYSVDASGQKISIPQNQALYRFAFVEKNRIDSFARITATTASAQKDRIATLFGLDAFSAFVDGFTDDFEKYITLVNAKAIAFEAESKKHDEKKNRVAQIGSDLLEIEKNTKSLIKEVSQIDVFTVDDLKLFLNGADGISGHIGDLQRKKTEQIPEDLKIESLDSLPLILSTISSSLKSLDTDIKHFSTLSSDVNFKELYSTIVSIGTAPGGDKSRCPACKTPIEEVAVNPFENAINELRELKSLSELQDKIAKNADTLSKDVRTAISTIDIINQQINTAGYTGNTLSRLTEFVFNNMATIESWKPRLESELSVLETQTADIETIRAAVSNHNKALSEKRDQQKSVDEELKKYQAFHTRLVSLTTTKDNFYTEKAKLKKSINDFTAANEAKIKEIEEEKLKIATNQKYAYAYKKLIKQLKLTRNQLPSKLSTGLSEKVKEYYNNINAHDPNFELLDSLTLPATPGAKIEIKFKGDTRTHDALHILSEGHIKVLGLSILLAKVVHENLGFLIFDDIVNAIDDDHRGGVAELLLSHADLKDKQHILTCHGETFINKLEHTLGTSQADKHVKSYRFFPADTIETRGVKVSIGDSKHYLLKAKESLGKNNLKDSAADCRRAVESISYQLWKKLDRRLRVNLKVTMRSPRVPPDLSTVVDSLIKELKKISGVDALIENLSELKARYPWSLLNKGVHEDDDQPEFERKDILKLLTLIQNIEENVISFKLAVSGT